MKRPFHVPIIGMALLLAGGSARAEAPPLPFLNGPGPVNEAMKTVWQAGFEAPQTTESAGLLNARVALAKRVLDANQAAARVILLASLRALGSEDFDGFRSLRPLVDHLGDDPTILAHLEGLLAGVPSRSGGSEAVPPPDRLVRQLAVSEIADLGQNGSRRAAALLADLVQGPDPAVVAVAVRTYYALSSDRRLAQRELRRRMPPANRYLLYVN
jgi:hypothetical protein